MGNKDENNEQQNIMDDVINDIAAGAGEEAAVGHDTPAGAETIVVKFEDEIDAARAVRVVNKALRKRHETIYQGAMVSRQEADEYKVEDLRDMGLSDVITGTAAIGFNLGRDGFRLVWAAASTGVALITSGLRLLRRTALLTAGLAGSTWTIPRRRRLDDYNEEAMEDTATDLEPGSSAVVIVADHETAAELATELVRSGGELV